MMGETVIYEVCAVDLGVDPDGPHVTVILDNCVSEKAVRKAIMWLAKDPKYDNSFLFARSVTTVTTRKRLAAA